ncbi:hypothetical protein GCM10017687_61740 [Streptomyces echinatus]
MRTWPGSDQPRPDAREETERRRRAFAVLLGEFRRTPVLVPLGDGPGRNAERGLPTADFNGVRLVLALPDGQAPARCAVARGEAARQRRHRTIPGARLPDAAVPTAGVPCGMALGHEGLADEFRSFCDRWEWGVRSLTNEGNGFAGKTVRGPLMSRSPSPRGRRAAGR